MKITFSLSARIPLCNVLRIANKDLAIDDDNRTIARSILLKIRVPVEESAALETLLRTHGPSAAEMAIRKTAPIDVDLEPAEVRKLINTIDKGKWGPEDDDWFVPLKKQLTAPTD